MKTTVLLAALTLSASVLAQQPATPPSSSTPGATPPSVTTPGLTSPIPGAKSPAAWPTFETLDTNSDARISSTEAATSIILSNRFSALDKGGKGYLTREEYQAAMRAGDRERTGSDTN